MRIPVSYAIEVKEVRTPELRLYKSVSLFAGEYKISKPKKIVTLQFMEAF